MIDNDGVFPDPEPDHRHLRRRRVLLAEPSLGSRRLLGAQLEREGLEVVAVQDGLEALDALLELAPGEPEYPDLLVVGSRMAGLGGVDVLEALRLADARTPVIVLATSADRAVRRRVLDLGCAVLLEGTVDAVEVASWASRLLSALA